MNASPMGQSKSLINTPRNKPENLNEYDIMFRMRTEKNNRDLKSDKLVLEIINKYLINHKTKKMFEVRGKLDLMEKT